MSAQQDFFRLIDSGGQIGRASMVGVELLHQRPIRLSDLVEARTRLKPQDLVGFLLRHYSRMRVGARPRVAITLSVFTPAGKPAVKISL